MRKILNVTQNETRDIIDETREEFDPPRKYELYTEHAQVHYTIKDKPPHWKDTDEYKIITL